jgi:hypothetical protein
MINQSKGRIIAHRGCWAGEANFTKLPQNSSVSLELALNSGFGIEIDIRDYKGQIYVSHDPILDIKNCVSLESILDKNFDQTIALNVKSDGLLNLLRQTGFEKLHRKKHFFFDLSFPEEIKYTKLDQVVATRVSEFEALKIDSSHHLQEYLWVDSFSDDWWIKDDLILNILKNNSKVIVVSPELHGRDPKLAWLYLCEIWSTYENLLVCTDYPFTLCEMLTK